MSKKQNNPILIGLGVLFLFAVSLQLIKTPLTGIPADSTAEAIGYCLSFVIFIALGIWLIYKGVKKK